MMISTALDQEDADLRARMGIGGNHPPKSDIEMFVDQVKERASPHITRFSELMASCDRAPLTCDDEDASSKLTDLVSQLSANAKSLEAERVREKAPHLEKGNAVQSLFASYTDAIDTKVRAFKTLMTGYLVRKAAAEKLVAQRLADEQAAEALRQSERAQALEQAGKVEEAAEAIEKAVVAEDSAWAATKAIAAATNVKSRGSYGGSTSLTRRWVGTIVDRDKLDLEKLRPHFGTDDLQKALNKFVAANCKGDVGSTLDGAAIIHEANATTRK